ncbi:hypothetical protein AAFF_G00186100 [Aldrovandia affinis]|uniref:Ubiquitin carboxyl-terminal hydrolase MINDY n=1 Tax=Aldrovandia affinis TaxID=143900 RepID=A0AAD7WVM8_9TELE|nr:hypothetical protein AAFF_G00186100 [Aldrovandia affinis]
MRISLSLWALNFTMKDDADSDVASANTEIDDILSQISDLDKWREIFNSRGEGGCESCLAPPAYRHLQNTMAEYQELLNTIRALQPSRQNYIEILQKEVQRSQDRPLERGKPEEEGEDGAGRPPSSSRPSRENTMLLTVPYSIPRALAISPGLGGLPVSPELAVNLRKVLFGNTFHIFNYEWKKPFFKFREPYSDLGYALEAERGGARAIQMVVQANIIKYLLFTRNTGSGCSHMQSLSEVGEKEQERALAAALTDILWTAGEEQSATVSLVTSEYSFAPHLEYKLDNFTERLQLFNFKEKEDIQKFIYEHIQCFKEEGSHGVILFLYSLIFSRTIDRLREDLDSTTSHLLHVSLGNFACRQALMNLLLTGRASPNVFNGTLQYDEHGDPLEQPLHGILARSDVGYLHWSREQVDHSKLPMVGSMLKTPKLPIWVCSINGTYSILFSPNRSLLSDWKMEHLFDLHFYNGQPSQKSTALLTIGKAHLLLLICIQSYENMFTVGSMLKTPKLPIWVCSINGTYSILFSPNRSLLSDWKMEHLFDLHFYNGQPSQKSTALLTIDTHSHHWETGKRDSQGDPEKRFPSVEMTIRTKWEGAAIDWNGTVPFF